MKKLINNLKRYWLKGVSLVYLFSYYRVVLAASGGVIPISSTDQTNDNSDFATTLVTILQKDILPIVEIGGAAVILFIALNGLWSGYKDYQKDKNMDHLKSAVLSSVILIVVGGAVLYLLERLRNYTLS